MGKRNLRIIAGSWRGRQVPLLDSPGLRPTPARVRETLFNWLQGKIEGATCLDCFCGSGALGLEALSRGAKEVLFLDQATKVVRQINQNLRVLEAKNAQVLQVKSQDWLQQKRTVGPFDIVFLDPPFHRNFILSTIDLLIQNKHLANKAYLYIESEKNLHLPTPQNWQLHKEKSTATLVYRLFQVYTAKKTT